jgi:putative ABC transport system substrate-binding protein
MNMRRREFITLLGGAAAAWPIAVRAQQAGRMPRIGYMVTGSETDSEAQARHVAFREALAKFGWADGRNVRIDYRWSVSGPARLRTAAQELVSLAPNVILAEGNPNAMALRDESRIIPIVFVNALDPLTAGLVDSIARPSGNLTGFTNFDFPIGGKWLQMLKEVAPGIKRVLVILFLASSGQQGLLRAIAAAAPVIGVELLMVDSTAPEIERGINAFAQEPNGGLLVLFGGTALENRDLITGLAARHRLPAMYTSRPFIASGGLMSYDTDIVDLFRRAASYVDRILRGEKPGDLPVQNPTKFELVINQKVAKALGLTVPLPLLALADEVIE